MQNLVVFLLDEFLDGLECLISLLHTEQTLLPIFKQCLLTHYDSFDFNGCLFECVPGCCCFFLLRDKLSLIERFLLVKPLNFLIHLINEQILFLLGLFEVTDIFFCSVGCSSGNSDFTLHHFIVLFNLFKSTVELIELLLGFENPLELLISLFFLAFVLSLKDFILSFRFNSIPLNDVVVIVSALKCRLHPSKLVLNSIELYTRFFS